MVKTIVKLIDLENDISWELPIQPILTIGRSPDSDVPLEDKTVSAFHAQIYQAKKQTPYIMDSSSKNGTFVDSERVSGDMCAALYDGAKLKLGDYKLKVRIQ